MLTEARLEQLKSQRWLRSDCVCSLVSKSRTLSAAESASAGGGKEGGSTKVKPASDSAAEKGSKKRKAEAYTDATKLKKLKKGTKKVARLVTFKSGGRTLVKMTPEAHAACVAALAAVRALSTLPASRAHPPLSGLVPQGADPPFSVRTREWGCDGGAHWDVGLYARVPRRQGPCQHFVCREEAPEWIGAGCPTEVRWCARHGLTQVRAKADGTGRVLSALFEKLPSPEELPQYYQVVTHPVDLARVDQALAEARLESVQAFVSEVDTMFVNARTFNLEASQVSVPATSRTPALKKVWFRGAAMSEDQGALGDWAAT